MVVYCVRTAIFWIRWASLDAHPLRSDIVIYPIIQRHFTFEWFSNVKDWTVWSKIIDWMTHRHRGNYWRPQSLCHTNQKHRVQLWCPSHPQFGWHWSEKDPYSCLDLLEIYIGSSVAEFLTRDNNKKKRNVIKLQLLTLLHPFLAFPSISAPFSQQFSITNHHNNPLGGVSDEKVKKTVGKCVKMGTRWKTSMLN